MPRSMRNPVAARKREIPANPRRYEAADASRRASWQIAKLIAADLGLSPSSIYDWTSGEKRSPVEAVEIWTDRALREGLPEADALALVTYLADRFLTVSPPHSSDAAADNNVVGACAAAMQTTSTAIQEAIAAALDGEITPEERKTVRATVESAQRDLQLLLHAVDRAAETLRA